MSPRRTIRHGAMGTNAVFRRSKAVNFTIKQRGRGTWTIIIAVGGGLGQIAGHILTATGPLATFERSRDALAVLRQFRAVSSVG
jgi:hypothetical protein